MDWVDRSRTASPHRVSIGRVAALRVGCAEYTFNRSDSIRSDDLLRQIGRPKGYLEIARRLGRIAEEEAETRKRQLKESHDAADASVPSIRRMPKKNGEIDWKAASETPLFRLKRAETLASIYAALHHLAEVQNSPELAPGQAVLVQKADGPEVRWSNGDLGKSVRTALREIKKNGVSRRILEVNVCGAAPTYRQILGGKLAAMSLFSSEIQDEYVDRYASTPSQIASCMAGRPICKRSHICALTTTSLYGVGSSQYNRVRVSCGERTLEWKRIGETEGFGAVHFSKPTIEAVRQLAVKRRGMRNVNNLFGEGTSPLMRQMREGLSMLGFESNDVLQHANKRIVYATEVYPHAREDLLADKDSYSKGPSFASIAAQWQKRWLHKRIQSDDVLESLKETSAASVHQDLIPDARGD
jgi:hypothetical protein